MTLYLNPDLTVEDIKAAKAAGVVGIKSYPKGNPSHDSILYDIAEHATYPKT